MPSMSQVRGVSFHRGFLRGTELSSGGGSQEYSGQCQCGLLHPNPRLAGYKIMTDVHWLTNTAPTSQAGVKHHCAFSQPDLLRGALL